MRGMCKVFLVGRLGADPELRASNGGNVRWCTFSVATNHARKEGEAWVEEAQWHHVKVFGEKGEACHRMLRKGSIVTIEGSLRHDSWQDAEGKKRFWTNILADRVDFVSGVARATATGSDAEKRGTEDAAEASEEAIA
jgi:single-strand DNA-binding protein